MKISTVSLSPEEKMSLMDMIQSDSWATVRKISDHHYQNCLEMLLSASDSGDFRHTQGIAHGWKMLVDMIESYAKPVDPLYSYDINESSLNARKK